MSPLAPAQLESLAVGGEPAARLSLASAQALAAAKSGASPRARAAAESFEAVFLSQMLAPMFESLETEGLFGGGAGERIYRSLMVEEYGKAIARSGGVGIADAVQREILKLQEVDG